MAIKILCSKFSKGACRPIGNRLIQFSLREGKICMALEGKPGLSFIEMNTNLQMEQREIESQNY